MTVSELRERLFYVYDDVHTNIEILVMIDGVPRGVDLIELSDEENPSSVCFQVK